MKEYSGSDLDKIIMLNEQWCGEFEKSHQYAALTVTGQEEAPFITETFMEMMYNYHQQGPSDWSTNALDEVIGGLFPRKVSAGDEFYGNVEPVLSAYFAFLDERKYISNGKTLIQRLARAAVFMRKSASDPFNWSLAKQLVMEAQGQGVDLHDELARERFIQRYNQSLHAQPAITKKVGRNDPCPCGSGKKFKKCCGIPNVGPLPPPEEEIVETHKEMPDVYPN